MKNDMCSFAIITEYNKTIYTVRYKSYNEEILASTLRDTRYVSGNGTDCQI
jgi:hypothetical protein